MDWGVGRRCLTTPLQCPFGRPFAEVMPVIDSFEISNYKAFSTLRLDPLPRVMAVGGRNNCGKTSLLEAMFLFLDRNTPELLTRNLAWRGFEGFRGPAPTLLENSFRNFDLDFPIEVSGRVNGVREQLQVKYVKGKKPHSVSVEEAQLSSSSSEEDPAHASLGPSDHVLLRLKREDEPEWEEARITFASGQIQMDRKLGRPGRPNAKYQGLRIRNTPQDDAEFLGKLQIEGKANELQTFVNTLFPEVQSISAIPFGGTSMIFADVGLSKKIAIPLLGDGVARLVSYFLCAYGVRGGGLLLLDEVGAGFHHSLLPALWEGLILVSRNFD